MDNLTMNLNLRRLCNDFVNHGHYYLARKILKLLEGEIVSFTNEPACYKLELDKIKYSGIFYLEFNSEYDEDNHWIDGFKGSIFEQARTEKRWWKRNGKELYWGEK